MFSFSVALVRFLRIAGTERSTPVTTLSGGPMPSSISRTSLAALCACTLLAACAKSDKNADSTTMADSSAAMAPAPATNPAPAPALTDANIAAILDNANAADSAFGSVAATKGTNAEVKAFGRDMMRDHHALRQMGQDLVKKLNVTPEMPAGDSSVAQAKAWQDSLNATAKGAAFDKAYIDHEVAYHQAVIGTARTAETAAQNAELKALITKAIPNLESHLKKAQDIQSKLGKA
jgi:putative membrane protein